MEILNCTPHPIVYRMGDGNDLSFAPSGTIPRVSVEEIPAGQVYIQKPESIGAFYVETAKVETGEVTGLPDEENGVLVLVSGMVFAATNRQDVIAPDTGKSAIRNEKGQIVAVTRFLRK